MVVILHEDDLPKAKQSKKKPQLEDFIQRPQNFNGEALLLDKKKDSIIFMRGNQIQVLNSPEAKYAET